MKKILRKQKGITLIVLVITIIVLIILAGISIAVLTGEDGLITKAKQGAQNYQNASIEEQQALNSIYTQAGTQLAVGSINNGVTSVNQGETTGGSFTQTDRDKLDALYNSIYVDNIMFGDRINNKLSNTSVQTVNLPTAPTAIIFQTASANGHRGDYSILTMTPGTTITVTNPNYTASTESCTVTCVDETTFTYQLTTYSSYTTTYGINFWYQPIYLHR